MTVPFWPLVAPWDWCASAEKPTLNSLLTSAPSNRSPPFCRSLNLPPSSPLPQPPPCLPPSSTSPTPSHPPPHSALPPPPPSPRQAPVVSSLCTPFRRSLIYANPSLLVSHPHQPPPPPAPPLPSPPCPPPLHDGNAAAAKAYMLHSR